ncbi:MAG TPA: helix-turn-helix transcriptional regulator [Thermoanaerobaculia bacterium]|jgi:transcriptional regulator with XRE-family HTH domain|nr:helix-turn-helix transcriptional regulator [Thermoanaerobaculia bacterium]
MTTRNEFLVEIGRRIGRLRQRKGWSQTELAQQLGVSLDRVSSWERGRYLPAIDGLLALRWALGVSMDELLTGEPPEPALSRERWIEVAEHLAALTELLKPVGKQGGRV